MLVVRACRLAAALACVSAAARADVYTVTTTADVVSSGDGLLSLREAVALANEHPGLDTIELPATGYTLSIPNAGGAGDSSGDLDVRDPLVVRATGPSQAVIDAGGIDRHFHVFDDISLRLEGLHLRGGRANFGGSIEGGSHYGPVLVELVRCTLRDNVATSRGGAIRVRGALGLEDCELLFNTARADDGGPAYGGAIALMGSLVLRRTYLVGNSAEAFASGPAGTWDAPGPKAVASGGAIWARLSGNHAYWIERSLFYGNRAFAVAGEKAGATAAGGAFDITGFTGSDSLTASFQDTWIVENAAIARAEAASASAGGGAARAILSTGQVGVSLSLFDCVVRGNRAVAESDSSSSARGGAFKLGCGTGRTNLLLFLNRSSVESNLCAGESGGGGAVTASAETGAARVVVLSMESSLIDNAVVAESGSGGSLSLSTGTGDALVFALLVRSTLARNLAPSGGGGVSADSKTGNARSIAYGYASTISGNEAETGGAFRLLGGISSAASQLALVDCTVAGNRAERAGGIFVDSTAQANASLVGSLVATNVAADGPDVHGPWINHGRNILGDGTGGTPSGAPGLPTLIGTASSPVDPLIGPLADNGGGTWTHALLPGSPAIDPIPTGDPPTSDQRGEPRPADGNGDGKLVKDIGAFELQPDE